MTPLSLLSGVQDPAEPNVMNAKVNQRIIRAQYELPKDVPLSREGQDLLARLFVSDPRKRPTAQQIQQHPWLSGASPDITKQQPPSSRAVTCLTAKGLFVPDPHKQSGPPPSRSSSIHGSQVPGLAGQHHAAAGHQTVACMPSGRGAECNLGQADLLS